LLRIGDGDVGDIELCTDTFLQGRFPKIGKQPPKASLKLVTKPGEAHAVEDFLSDWIVTDERKQVFSGKPRQKEDDGFQ
jgi:hypothetical protein